MIFRIREDFYLRRVLALFVQGKADLIKVNRIGIKRVLGCGNTFKYHTIPFKNGIGVLGLTAHIYRQSHDIAAHILAVYFHEAAKYSDLLKAEFSI